MRKIRSSEIHASICAGRSAAKRADKSNAPRSSVILGGKHARTTRSTRAKDAQKTHEPRAKHARHARDTRATRARHTRETREQHASNARIARESRARRQTRINRATRATRCCEANAAMLIFAQACAGRRVATKCALCRIISNTQPTR